MSLHGSAALAVALPSRICVSIGVSSPEELLRLAHTEASCGETLFEFCLEFLTDPYDGPSAVRDFVRRWPDAWIIVTCRKDERSFHGPLDEQLALLSDSVEAGARVIDLEIETAGHASPWMRQMGGHCVRIVSYHNYQAAPPLASILRNLEAIPADIIKVAVATQDAQTLCSLIEQARHYPRPAIFLAMGPAGLPTRILGPCAGRSFTYGSLPSANATATGQLDVRILRETYRLDEISSATTFIAGFPDPTHELSDSVEYNKILAASGARMIYVPWPGVSTIPSVLFSPALQTRGLALHHRFARQAFAFADRVELEAENAGIIDTLWKGHGRWHAGWKLGDTIVNSLQATISPGAGVAVIARDPQLQRAAEELLRAHRYRTVAPSQAECSVNLTQMALSYLGRNDKVNLRDEVIQRQVECWARGMSSA